MSKYASRPEDIIHNLQKRLDAVEADLARTKNLKTISVPIVDIDQDPGLVAGKLMVNSHNSVLGYTHASNTFTQGVFGRRVIYGTGITTQGTTTTLNVALEPYCTYLLSALLSGPNQEINALYAVHTSPANVNIGKTNLSTKSYNLGTFVVQTQNNGGDYAFNASSDSICVLKFTAATTASGGGNAAYHYMFIPVGHILP